MSHPARPTRSSLSPAGSPATTESALRLNGHGKSEQQRRGKGGNQRVFHGGPPLRPAFSSCSAEATAVPPEINQLGASISPENAAFAWSTERVCKPCALLPVEDLPGFAAYRGWGLGGQFRAIVNRERTGCSSIPCAQVKEREELPIALPAQVVFSWARFCRCASPPVLRHFTRPLSAWSCCRF